MADWCQYINATTTVTGKVVAINRTMA
jgi:hypothetical protein